MQVIIVQFVIQKVIYGLVNSVVRVFVQIILLINGANVELKNKRLLFLSIYIISRNPQS